MQAHFLKVIVPDLHLTGRTATTSLELDSPQIKIAQNSSHTAQTSISLVVPGTFDNQGRLLSHGTIALKGLQTYHLGNLHADGCFTFAPQDLPPIYDLYNSPDPALTQNGGLYLVSARDEVFDQSLERPFSIGLKARSMRVTQPLTSPYDLSFESTQGPIHVGNDLSGRTLNVLSAESLACDGLIKLTGHSCLRATGPFTNNKQLYAKSGHLHVEAASICNI